MKIRNGFVSNSSSEAFILSKEYADVEKIEADLRKLLALHSELTGEKYIFEEVFQLPKKITNLKGEYFYSWIEYDRKPDRDAWNRQTYLTDDELKDRVVIYSVSDNTIPYPLVEYIESLYDAERIHLG